MSKKLLFSIFISAAVLTLAGFVVRPVLSHDGEPMTRKIIVYKSQGGEEKIAKHNGVKIKHLKSINADAAFLTPTAVKALEKDADVLRVEDDVVVEAFDKKIILERKGAPAQPTQALPWGIDRIDADLAWSTTAGDPVKIPLIYTRL